VRTIDVSIGHDDDAVVAQFGWIETVTIARTHGRDEGADFLEGNDLVFARAFDVQDLAFERQNGLEAAIATLLGRATGRVAFDQEQLAPAGIFLGAVGKLAG
jgi:hypothetical protein